MRLFLTTLLVTLAMHASADNYLDMEPVTLEVPEMEAKLVKLDVQPAAYVNAKAHNMSTTTTTNHWKPDFDFFKSKTNPGVKPYKFMDDMTFVGVPLFVAGLALKGDKAMFRVNNKDGKKNTQLLTDFKTGIDDYAQFLGPAMVVGLKLGGYEGRSDWPRLLASAAMGYGIMAGLVNGIKYSAKEMRPDGSQANSWPSGHTATAFVGATLLHKEYGLTRSPWFSVAGYGAATATGVMRVLNNRHWVSDVMSGAGIGILSGELGYALCDLLFKGKGLLRNDLEMDFNNPTFFSVSMGVGLGTKNIDFGVDDLVGIERFSAKDIAEARAEEGEDGKENFEFRAATVVDAEGAYFFNKYIGIGGRLRVRAMSAKSFERFTDLSEIAGPEIDAWDQFYEYSGKPKTMEEAIKWDERMWGDDLEDGPVTDMNAVVQSDHLTEFSASIGLYLNLPLSDRFALGTKFLIGRSMTQEMDIDGYATGKIMNMDHDITLKNGNISSINIEYPTSRGDYEYNWDYMTLGGNNSTTWGTGLSLTYRYKSNFSWKVFIDYDYTKKDFTLKYDPLGYMRSALTKESYVLAQNIETLNPYLTAMEYKKTKKMNYVTLGLSFLVNL
ncbi:MAG: phosphatase PAP2 family protein [Prevotella sp.]|nr:phosphatase PAP2 family protein [Prevotella sp.]